MKIEVPYEDWKLDLLTLDSHWTANIDTLIWQISGELTYRYVTRFFSEAKTLLNNINLEELNNILWLLIHDVLNVSPDEYPPPSLWKDYFVATKILFRDLFNCYCADVLGHRDEQPTTPLNSCCYMWWDVVPVWHPEPTSLAQIQTICLETIAYCLTLDNIACKESALHGLGHWFSVDSDTVRTIIQDHDCYIPEKLKNYAQSAICGCVL